MYLPWSPYGHRTWMPIQDIVDDHIRKKAQEKGVPIIPPHRPIPYDPNPTVAICGLCGLELKRVMMYSCNRPGCPCFTQTYC